MAPIDVNIVESCDGMNCLTIKDWLPFWGTMLGALIGAALGSLGSYLLLKRSVREEEKKLYEDFYKEYRRVDRMLDIFIERMFILKKDWSNKQKNMNYKKVDLTLVERVRNDINKIPNSLIPRDIFDFIEGIENEIGGIEAKLLIYYEYGNYNTIPFDDNYLPKFSQELDKITELKQKIKIIYD
ncbi:hypothetical protein [Virgibacillus salexigens]|uniref:hypothetical protein n=1 Tax=Virgibacillus salexigens TaxID=61016 RepID=UPI00190A7713|nr:hypothetical protein [Virgibacillus salexigens]